MSYWWQNQQICRKYVLTFRIYVHLEVLNTDYFPDKVPHVAEWSEVGGQDWDWALYMWLLIWKGRWFSPADTWVIHAFSKRINLRATLSVMEIAASSVGRNNVCFLSKLTFKWRSLKYTLFHFCLFISFLLSLFLLTAFYLFF